MQKKPPRPTPQKRQRKEVNAGEERFRQLLEKLPAGAYTCDTDGLITYFNQYAVRLWGRAPKLFDPIDRFCGSWRLFSADGAPLAHDQCWMALALRENQAYDGQEIIIERPDGQRLTVLAHANPIHDEHGTLSGAVNVLVDITDRKRAQDASEAAHRRKDEFLATLAHELRNPLAPIRNGLYLLPTQRNDEAAFEETRRMMETQLRHMVHLLDDLMDISRISRNKVQLRKDRVELAWVVNDAVEATRPLIEERQHHLQVRLPAEAVYLDADSVRLTQVFSNLLNNAAKYTDSGGQITLEAEVVAANEEVIVRVRDNGLGIPAELLAGIFNLYEQSDRARSHGGGGLGIGLSLVKSLVQMHGGQVEAHSAGPDKGSEFVVRLPVLTAEAALTAVAENPLIPAGLPLRILVVDDNRSSADTMAMVLRSMGHEVRVAYEGRDAIAAAEEFNPEAALLDVGLPDLDGHEVGRLLRARTYGESMTLIAMTGWGRDEDRQRSLTAGFDAHLVKPVKMSAVCDLLAARALSSGSSAPPVFDQATPPADAAAPRRISAAASNREAKRKLANRTRLGSAGRSKR